MKRLIRPADPRVVWRLGRPARGRQRRGEGDIAGQPGLKTVADVAGLREQVANWRRRGDRVALVPTMGALHAGHLALLAEARRRARRTIVSIFVNPMQFAAGEDWERYPRREEEDARLLATAGADLLFLPRAEDVYPPDFQTVVSVRGLDAPLEGAARPGHFEGVATIVLKLFLMAFPDVALFGEKDWQQLAIIRRLTADLALPIEIVGCPTVREADGLALSSRNAYLAPDERVVAGALPRTLAASAEAIRQGAGVAETLATARAALQSAGIAVDYLELADPHTLERRETAQGATRLFLAARLGRARLVDNWPVTG